ncbi:MAG: CPBP family intramembrane metalloprotease [Leptolyngbyaceae cyanobacterium SM2_5_2]|nr:CPBP family intramembrane metalloprotease [Leptolyngbyaceae cyanobacterium SM2_5_2]
MGLTAIVLLLIAKVWLHFDSTGLLPLQLSWLHGLWGVALGLVITLASAGVYQLWPGYRKNADSYLAMVLRPLHWFDLLWLGLLPGLSEELLFRGVMLPAIGLNRLGIFVSGASFGILHMSSLQQWPYMLWATVVGMALATSAVVTGNLLVPVVAHVVVNLVSSLVWKVRQPPHLPSND